MDKISPSTQTNQATIIPITQGGTDADTAAEALVNLGVTALFNTVNNTIDDITTSLNSLSDSFASGYAHSGTPGVLNVAVGADVAGVEIEMWGAGAGAYSGSTVDHYEGGTAGSYIRFRLATPAPITLNFHIGTGGSPHIGDSNSTAGGDTYLLIGGLEVARAPGGASGVEVGGGGGPGAPVMPTSTYSTALKISGQQGDDGGDGMPFVRGGSAPFGGAGGCAGQFSNGSGVNGCWPGGGGGANADSRIGGGANGGIIVTFFKGKAVGS